MLWCYNFICRMLHPISMNIFEGHLGMKWSTKKWWRHQKRDSAVILLFLFLNLQNLPGWNGWTDQGKNFTRMTAYPWGTKGSHIWCHRWQWFDSHIGFTLKLVKIFSSRTAGQIEGKLQRNVPQGIFVQFCEGIIDSSHGLAVILDFRQEANS